MFDWGDDHKKHIPEPDLVPILDALTSVIFFLLLSTTFVEYTKLTLPPSTTVTKSESSQDQKPPLEPMIKAKVKGQELELEISWKGEAPGQISETVQRGNSALPNEAIKTKLQTMTKTLLEKMKSEPVRLGLSKDASYQEMLTIMDSMQVLGTSIVLVNSRDME